MSNGLTLVYHLMKNRGITIRFRDQQSRTFAPAAWVPDRYVDDLLIKQKTTGNCCGKQGKTYYLFATAEQLESGERIWIE